MLTNLLTVYLNHPFAFGCGFFIGVTIIYRGSLYLYENKHFVRKNTFVDVIVTNGSVKMLRPINKSNVDRINKMYCFIFDSYCFIFEIPIRKIDFVIKPKGDYEAVTVKVERRDSRYFVLDFCDLHKHNGRTFEIRFN